jgi:hypothetical protein
MPGQNPVKVFETGVRQVAAGSQFGGWVSGTISNLAASASFTSVFDLGSDWDQYNFVQLLIAVDGPSTGLINVTAESSDTPTRDPRRRLAPGFSGSPTGLFSTFSSGDYRTAWFRPAGRYFITNGSNGDASNATGGSSKFVVSAHPY